MGTLESQGLDGEDGACQRQHVVRDHRGGFGNFHDGKGYYRSEGLLFSVICKPLNTRVRTNKLLRAFFPKNA
jgi:hypothetical protein